MKTKLLNFLIVVFLSLVTFHSCSNEDFMDEPMSINSNAIIVPDDQGDDGTESWYSVFLEDAGPNKLKVIKVVKAFLKCELVIAKGFVDAAPKELAIIKRREKAEKFKTDLEEAGAKVKMEPCNSPF